MEDVWKVRVMCGRMRVMCEGRVMCGRMRVMCGGCVEGEGDVWKGESDV